MDSGKVIGNVELCGGLYLLKESTSLHPKVPSTTYVFQSIFNSMSILLDIVQLFFSLFLLFSYCIVGPMSMYIYIYIYIYKSNM